MTTLADRGLIITMRELVEAQGRPQTSSAIARALGIPDEYTATVEQRLERNRDHGLVERNREGRWQLTLAGMAAAVDLTYGDRPEAPAESR